MKAYELIDSPEKWFRGTENMFSGKYCIGLALNKCYRDQGSVALLAAWKKVADYLGVEVGKVVKYNDTHTYEECLAALKGADV